MYWSQYLRPSISARENLQFFDFVFQAVWRPDPAGRRDGAVVGKQVAIQPTERRVVGVGLGTPSPTLSRTTVRLLASRRRKASS